MRASVGENAACSRVARPTAPVCAYKRDALQHERVGALGQPAGRGRRREHRRDALVVPAGRHAEQVLEVVEVHVDRAQRHLGPVRDLAGGRAELPVGEQVEQRVGDGVSGLGRPGGAPVGRSGRVGGRIHLDRLGPPVHEGAMYGWCTRCARSPDDCRAGSPGSGCVIVLQCRTRTFRSNARAWNSPSPASPRCGARTAAKVSNDDILAANEADAEAVRWQLQRRLASLDDDVAVLCFGRIDEESGERWYVGRRHIEDGDGTPVVVDWRAGVATPFYRATLADPFGLERRRRFVFSARELTDVFEEDFSDPDSLAGSGGVPDPLLAELGRARTGQMRDIVATIQAEQDAIIRAPIETCLSCKAVRAPARPRSGLHRAAFLLYEHRVRLAREGVLVVGPEPGVPALHLAGACRRSARRRRRRRRSTVCSRCGSASWPRIPIEVAAVKGDARLAEVIARGRGRRDPRAGRRRDRAVPHPAVDDRRRRRARRSSTRRARRDAPFATQRERFRQSLIRRAYDRYTGGVAIELDEQRLRRRAARPTRSRARRSTVAGAA